MYKHTHTHHAQYKNSRHTQRLFQTKKPSSMEVSSVGLQNTPNYSEKLRVRAEQRSYGEQLA